ncbi:hypothetical protein SCA6_000878 [Theobroma cacao]|nr:PREDICTED: uncharacterized protein LOC18587025 [Theobroma cacao]
MMAANAKYTNVKFTNSSDQILKQNAVTIWDGPLGSVVPLVINVGSQVEFNQVGSLVGFECKFGETCCTLIVAWSNNGVSNKVYAQILPAGPGTHTVEWAQIRAKLEKSGSNYDTGNQFGYKCTLEIDPKSGTPTMKGTFTTVN